MSEDYGDFFGDGGTNISVSFVMCGIVASANVACDETCTSLARIQRWPCTILLGEVDLLALATAL